jgi:hypothetical protein
MTVAAHALHHAPHGGDSNAVQVLQQVRRELQFPCWAKLAEAFILSQNERELDVILANPKGRMET